ncbi:MAG: peroxiredoxin [Pseudomonadota bacterium]|nr:peroxiredoxin [Pseudomonadota bacterium]
MSNIPRIGDPAPDFTANTTQGPLTFSEWQNGKWVVFFSHPADFTPVCTTELAEFSRRSGEFEARNTKLIGLSIDSIHSHLAWLESIETNMGVEVPFPMIADIDTKVAQAYGMIHPGESSTVTVRAVFVIDPSRTVRALIYYPLTNGRNIDEVLRLIDSLQASAANGIATPANWRPGDKVIVPPTTTVAARKARLADEKLEHVASYMALKSL